MSGLSFPSESFELLKIELLKIWLYLLGLLGLLGLLYLLALYEASMIRTESRNEA